MVQEGEKPMPITCSHLIMLEHLALCNPKSNHKSHTKKTRLISPTPADVLVDI